MYVIPESTHIEQGDVFDGCPLPVLLDSVLLPGENEVVVPTARVVVLTQTCDLEHFQFHCFA
jgi:hypothetical protein